MPRDPAGRVPRRPALDDRTAIGGLSQDLEHRRTHRGYGSEVGRVGLGEPDSELPAIAMLGGDDMVDDLRRVPAAAARAFPKLLGGGGGDGIEPAPRGLDQ